MAGASAGGLTPAEAFETIECALLSTPTAPRPALHTLSVLLHHGAAAPCSGPLALVGCLAVLGNASRYDERMLTSITHVANATLSMLGTDGLDGLARLTTDVAATTADALGVHEIIGAVEQMAAGTLDALGVPSCVFDSRLTLLPALFGLLYGGAEPGCDVPELRAFREALLKADETPTAALSEPRDCRRVRFAAGVENAPERRGRNGHRQQAATAAASSSSPEPEAKDEPRLSLEEKIKQLQDSWEPICDEKTGACPPIFERLSIYYQRWKAQLYLLLTDRVYRMAAIWCLCMSMVRSIFNALGARKISCHREPHLSLTACAPKRTALYGRPPPYTSRVARVRRAARAQSR